MKPIAIIAASIAINAAISFVLVSSGAYPPAFGYVAAACVMVSVLGAVLITVGVRKPGAIIVMIGCVPFLPIGLIGVGGGRKVLDELKQQAFERGD